MQPVQPLSQEGIATKRKSENPSNYYCLVSTLNPEGAEHTYRYDAYYVHIPPGLAREPGGRELPLSWVTIEVGQKSALERPGTKRAGEEGGLVRMGKCLLPDSEVVLEMVEKRLKRFTTNTWAFQYDKVNTSDNEKPLIQNLGWQCSEYFIVTNCNIDPDTGDLINCVVADIRCVEWEYYDDGPGGGDHGGGGDDPGPGDGGSGGPGDGYGGGDSGDPCDPDGPAQDLPVECLDPLDPVPNPCDTDDDLVDKMSELGILDQLWQESFGPGTGFDHDNRREMGGWLTQDLNGDYGFTPFPEGLESSICHISGVPPPPAGAVAVIHTHPAFPTERIKVESCIDRFINRRGITDLEARNQLRDQLLQTGLMMRQEPSEQDIEYSKAYQITSYYMDGTLIEKYYDGTNNKESDDVYSRCGY
ncbi:MAG: hypothetical protein JJU46_09125 [Balneolaceae bacterium]|nr:hypothetical protein [Balneolaceae bacterium]MCH8550270.1 hypothetical protein [Balneolaceae bacterium]